MKKNRRIIRREKIRRKWIRRFIVTGVVLCALIFGIIFGVNGISSALKNKRGEENNTFPDDSIELPTAHLDSQETRMPRGTEEQESPSPEQEPQAEFSDGLGDLGVELNTLLPTLSGNWSVYIKRLDTEEEYEYKNQIMPSESLIKLFIMASYLEDKDFREIDLSDAQRQQLKDMITENNNEAANELVIDLGVGNPDDGRYQVNAFCAEQGLAQTTINQDLGVPISDTPENNLTSARNVGTLLDLIYFAECVSPSASQEMLDILLAQTVRDKIPLGIPEGIEIANMHGSLGKIEHDAALVLVPDGCSYILVVMSSDVDSPEQARETIIDISEKVYRYLNE